MGERKGGCLAVVEGREGAIYSARGSERLNRNPPFSQNNSGRPTCRSPTANSALFLFPCFPSFGNPLVSSTPRPSSFSSRWGIPAGTVLSGARPHSPRLGASSRAVVMEFRWLGISRHPGERPSFQIDHSRRPASLPARLRRDELISILHHVER